MAPPKEKTFVPKKSQTGAQTIEIEIEESWGASSLKPKFP